MHDVVVVASARGLTMIHEKCMQKCMACHMAIGPSGAPHVRLCPHVNGAWSKPKRTPSTPEERPGSTEERTGNTSTLRPADPGHASQPAPAAIRRSRHGRSITRARARNCSTAAGAAAAEQTAAPLGGIGDSAFGALGSRCAEHFMRSLLLPRARQQAYALQQQLGRLNGLLGARELHELACRAVSRPQAAHTSTAPMAAAAAASTWSGEEGLVRRGYGPVWKGRKLTAAPWRRRYYS